jgi:hypothetical protein
VFWRCSIIQPLNVSQYQPLATLFGVLVKFAESPHRLIDHSIRRREQCLRHFDAERAPGLAVDDRFETVPPSAVRNPTPSFDHLLGRGEQRWRHAERQRLRCFQVEGQFEFGGLVERNVAGIGAVENGVDVIGRALEQLRQIE